ncbi:hypothetical protein A8709_25830 [Paenibacillus pectinilyticus]|uniref:Type 4 fimbrial biogenesis protein PilX N-terminal domain-containing protein n=1 Tax=Paenibacillus pectinilyticus TaxID=512399 RepID=A0A1C1A163_9BACL|nr:hypothetical protein [Paenibacillus pectinilyticus]OCT14254.1 hypothetical protein A8709_25830 [Paenibacillus pectinilyticus]
MLNRLKEERGAALLLVLFIIIVFTMIGMAVMSASIGGAVRSQTKQKDVQSVHLAEKALNEAVAMIQGKLTGQHAINLDLLADQLKIEIAKINDKSKNETRTEYAKSDVITNAELKQEEYPQKITISVTATIDGVTRSLEQNLIINSYPDALKYAGGSQDGNFIINGSPYFLGGDANAGGIYAGRQLLIKNEAEYYYESDDKKMGSTTFPSLEGTAYVQSLSSIRYCDTPNCTDYKPIQEATGNGEAKKAENILGRTSETQIKSNKDFIGINMNESFEDKLTEAIGGDARDWTYIDEHFNDMSAVMNYISGKLQLINGDESHISPIKPSGTDSTDTVTEYDRRLAKYKLLVNSEIGNETFLHRGNFNLNNLDYSQLLYATGVDSLGEKFGKTFRKDANDDGYYRSNWFIIDGDLNITNTTSTAIQVRANILVTGNVNIVGQVDMDSTIFALGNTVIEDASIKGLDNKELVLMSKGSILITRVNTNGDGLFKDIPDNQYELAFGKDSKNNGDIKRLDAFFYTDSTAELYGVGSIFWIRGGFFAKGDLTINAVRGRAEVVGTSIQPEEPQSNILGERARFIISYNKDIFIDQSAALPRVKSVQLLRGKKIMKVIEPTE